MAGETGMRGGFLRDPDESLILVGTLVGATGATGAKGATGHIGPPKGPRGATGAKGATHA